jgi:hypothetical protein
MADEDAGKLRDLAERLVHQGWPENVWPDFLRRIADRLEELERYLDGVYDEVDASDKEGDTDG